MTFKKYDNDQLDYLNKVKQGGVTLLEDWAHAEGLADWAGLFSSEVVLTSRGDAVLAANNWHREGRQIIESYPEQPAGPAPEELK